MKDNVKNPEHYTSHPSGVECIEITEHLSFCLGNAIKYIWRADLKGNHIEDLKKAKWYINREIERMEKKSHESVPVRKPVPTPVGPFLPTAAAKDEFF